MKKYFLNVGTGTLHITEFATKTCTGQMLKEHFVYFDSVEQAKTQCDRRVKECKLCFHRQEQSQAK